LSLAVNVYTFGTLAILPFHGIFSIVECRISSPHQSQSPIPFLLDENPDFASDQADIFMRFIYSFLNFRDGNPHLLFLGKDLNNFLPYDQIWCS